MQLSLESLIDGSAAVLFDPYSELKSLVMSCSYMSFYKEYEKEIHFELNHLELHKLDDYYVSLYQNETVFDKNPNNSYIAYLLGITREMPSGPVKTTGGSVPDWTMYAL